MLPQKKLAANGEWLVVGVFFLPPLSQCGLIRVLVYVVEFFISV